MSFFNPLDGRYFQVLTPQLLTPVFTRASVLRPLSNDDATPVLERLAQKIQPPQMHQVVVLNDDFTPIEFVVHVIMEVFGKDEDTSVALTLQIHTQGRGICGVFTYDIAATKVNMVIEMARYAGHPLQAVSEPIDM